MRQVREVGKGDADAHNIRKQEEKEKKERRACFTAVGKASRQCYSYISHRRGTQSLVWKSCTSPMHLC